MRNMKKILFSLLLLVAMVPLRASQLTVADGTQQNMYVLQVFGFFSYVFNFHIC